MEKNHQVLEIMEVNRSFCLLINLVKDIKNTIVGQDEYTKIFSFQGTIYLAGKVADFKRALAKVILLLA